MNYTEQIDISTLIKNNILISDNRYIKTVTKGTKSWEEDLGNVIYPKSIMVDKNNNHYIEFEYYSNSKIKSFTMLFSEFSGPNFFTVSANYGFLCSVDTNKRTFLKGLVMDLATYLMDNRETKKVVDQMGWDEDIDNFTIGNKIVNNNGNIEENTVDNNLVNVFSCFKTKGSFEEFKKSYEVFTMPKYIKHQMYFLLMIGTPLLKLNDLSGIPINFHSNESGGLKTVTQYMGNMFYSNNSNKIIDFTENFIFSRMGTYNSLPVVVDEVSDKLSDPKYINSIANIMYTMTGGSTKGRLTSSLKEEVQKTFSTSIFFSANKKLENVIPDDQSAVAKISRMYEISLGNDKFTNEYVKELKDALNSLKENYGHGIEFLRVVQKNKKEIKNKLNYYFSEFQDLFVESNYRYIANVWSCAVVSAYILREMGFSGFNEELVFNFFKNDISRIKENVKDKKINPLNIITQFISNHVNTIKFVKKAEVGNKLVGINSDPNYKYYARINKSTGEFAIDKHIFDEFLKTRYKITKFDIFKPYFDELGYQTKQVKINESGINNYCYVFNLHKDIYEDEKNSMQLEDEPIEKILKIFKKVN